MSTGVNSLPAENCLSEFHWVVHFPGRDARLCCCLPGCFYCWLQPLPLLLLLLLLLFYTPAPFCCFFFSRVLWPLATSALQYCPPQVSNGIAIAFWRIVYIRSTSSKRISHWTCSNLMLWFQLNSCTANTWLVFVCKVMYCNCMDLYNLSKYLSAARWVVCVSRTISSTVVKWSEH